MTPPQERYALTAEHRQSLDPAALGVEAHPPIAFHPGIDISAVFEAVAANRHPSFPDGKLLVDSYPLKPLDEIDAAYERALLRPDFDPNIFWKLNFRLPEHRAPQTGLPQEQTEIGTYIDAMWRDLSYHAPQDRGSLIGTPFPHLKPGERFDEGYYWDTADAVSGLLTEAATASDDQRAAKEIMVLNVIGNLRYLVDRYGYIPNGLRTYYEGRSHPPVFAGIVKEASAYFGDRAPNLIEECLPELTAEYEWWMRGEDEVATTGGTTASGRVVRLPDGSILNRHWDDNDTPRWESYEEDIETALLADADPQTVFRHLRASAESGRDHTARFMEDPERLATIHTADFLTPELNSLLWEYEDMIAAAHDRAGRSVLAAEFHERADRRKAAIDRYLWNDKDGQYYDYDFVKGQQSPVTSIGTAYPVARGVASPEQTRQVSGVLGYALLRRGGFVSATIESPQQWDAPNGFPRDQVEAVRALQVDGSAFARAVATTAAGHWLDRDAAVFAQTGTLVEKHDVVSEHARPGGGGEYGVQHGFLWTNGAHRVLEQALRDVVRGSLV